MWRARLNGSPTGRGFALVKRRTDESAPKTPEIRLRSGYVASEQEAPVRRRPPRVGVLSLAGRNVLSLLANDNGGPGAARRRRAVDECDFDGVAAGLLLPPPSLPRLVVTAAERFVCRGRYVATLSRAEVVNLRTVL